MDFSELFRGPWSEAAPASTLAGIGLLLTVLALAGAFPLRRRGWKSPIVIGLLALALMGIATAGLGGYFMKRSRALPMAPAGIEPPGALAGTEIIDQKELGALQKASLDVPRQPSNPSAPWPQWRGPNRDGISVETGIRTDWDQSPPKLLWKHPIEDGYSSFAVAGGRLYTMDANGKTERVLCLNADSGDEIWSYAYPSEATITSIGHYVGPRATPTLEDGHVYTVGARGDFYCLDEHAKDGKPRVLWKHSLTQEFDAVNSGYGLACSPLIEGDLVCVQPGGRRGSIAAFDKRSGKLAWTALTDDNGYSSPVAATAGGVRQIICFTGRGATGVRASDGSKLWYFPWCPDAGANIATPIVAGDYVFISSGHAAGAGCVLLSLTKDVAGGCKAEPVYIMRNKLMRNQFSSCVCHDGFLYGFDTGPGNLKCIDLRTGLEKWADKRRPKGSLIYADGHLIVLTDGGTLMAVKATPEQLQVEGTVRNVLQGAERWTLPVLANGRAYLRDQHEIVCLDVRKSSSN